MKARYILTFCAFLTVSHSLLASSLLSGDSANLLGQADVNQITTWVGEGDLSLTNIFTHLAGDNKTSLDFHAAVDGKGRTISVMRVDNYGRQIVGGYNPLSWDSSVNYHYAVDLADRTAFLFNLSTGLLQNERADYGGQFQTSNSPIYGPNFGGGHDLHVDGTLNSGYSAQYSYGEPGTNLIAFYGAPLKYGAIEVFAVNDLVATPAPLPSTFFAGAVLLVAATLLTRTGRITVNR